MSKQVYRWKGQFITKKMYDKRMSGINRLRKVSKSVESSSLEETQKGKVGREEEPRGKPTTETPTSCKEDRTKHEVLQSKQKSEDVQKPNKKPLQSPECIMMKKEGKRVTKKVYDCRIRMQETGKNIRKRMRLLDSMKNKEIEQLSESEVIQQPVEQTLSENHQMEEEIDIPETPEEQSEEQNYWNERRIVDLQFLASEMWCCSCKEALSFQYIEKEVRRGLASILTIRCHKCLIFNTVLTGKQQCPYDRRINTRYEINIDAVQGVIDNKMKYCNLRDMCENLNIPNIEYSTFSKYKRHLESSSKVESSVDDV